MCPKAVTNTGLSVLNDRPLGWQRTLIVSGVGRSGTTAMIGALYRMGLPLSGNPRPYTCDDWDIGPLIEDRDPIALQEHILLRNEQDVWGFKWHLLFEYPESLLFFRSPRIIIVVRDILATSLRANSEESQTLPLMKWLELTAIWNSHLASWLSTTDFPVCLVSYEKLLLRTEQVLKLVARFSGLRFVPAAAEWIDSLDNHYLETDTWT